jgi:hypothetical protein
MHTGVHLCKIISLEAFFQQPTEMGLVLLRLFLLQKLHGVSNVTTQDVLAVSFSIQTLVLFAKTRKPLLTMGNVQTSIQSTLY